MKTNWILDASHSEIAFKVKHLMITNVTGTFHSFQVHTETEDEDFSTAKISFEADTASIHTGSEQRDGHLKSADFFDVENYPQIKFESTSMERLPNGHYTLHGNFTIKGVSKPVHFEVEFGGVAKDPWGNVKAGFTLNGKINRTQWDLNWNAMLESGGLLVSEDVKLQAEIQLMKQVEQASA